MNAHFKPFAAIAYEYNRVRPNSGQPAFGQSIQFSIPQFGDFFHDMVVNTVLEKVSANTASAGQIPSFPTTLVESADGPSPGYTVSDDSAVMLLNDLTNNVLTRHTYQYVDCQGRVINRANNTYVDDASAYVARNFVRYCEYPGQRLLSRVRFEVNGRMNAIESIRKNVC